MLELLLKLKTWLSFFNSWRLLFCIIFVRYPCTRPISISGNLWYRCKTRLGRALTLHFAHYCWKLSLLRQIDHRYTIWWDWNIIRQVWMEPNKNSWLAFVKAACDSIGPKLIQTTMTLYFPSTSGTKVFIIMRYYKIWLLFWFIEKIINHGSSPQSRICIASPYQFYYMICTCNTNHRILYLLCIYNSFCFSVSDKMKLSMLKGWELRQRPACLVLFYPF